MREYIQYLVDTPNYTTKLMAFIAAAFGFVFAIFEKYIWSDWEFVGYLAAAIMIDTLLGMALAWKHKEFNSQAMGRIPAKIAIIAVSLGAIHVVSNFTVNGTQNQLVGLIVPYLQSVLYAFVIFREVISINEKLIKFGYPILPAGISRRLKVFQESGETAPPPPEQQDNPPQSGSQF